jgi:DNA-binding MarR family transcriptional regulator
MNNNKCENIGKYISQLHRKGNVFINRELSKYDLSVGQFMFLLDLYIKDGKNQEEISDNLKIDKGTTARAIKKLEEQGFEFTRICSIYIGKDKLFKLYVNSLNNKDFKKLILQELLTINEEEDFYDVKERYDTILNTQKFIFSKKTELLAF